MSRKGKTEFDSYGADINVSHDFITVSGKHGQVKIQHHAHLYDIKNENNKVSVVPKGNGAKVSPLWGTLASLLKNACLGAAEKMYEKKVQLLGVGFRVVLDGNNLVFQLGFSHPVVLAIPAGVTIKLVNPMNITIMSPNKEFVGAFADTIDKLRKHNPYHIRVKIIDDGKGVPKPYYEKKVNKK